MTKMEKQEALDFIFRELDNDRSQQEITALLCKQLGAPPDVVEKFVARVAAKRPEPAVEQEETATSPVIPGIEEIESAVDDSHDQIEETEPNYETRIDETSQPAWLESLSSKPKVDQAELEVMITKALAKNTRQSDVVVSVCEYTGMNWNEAQRLVAQVAMNKRKHLATRRNIIFIPMAVIAILAGLALVYASVSESYVIGSTMIEGAPLDSSTRDIETIVWAIPIGVGLLMGGGFGLYKALRTQLE
jgi:hypothetical protein